MPTEIGSYEAKSKLPEYLRRVKLGERFLITHHGHPVAELTPPAEDQRLTATAAVQAMKAIPRIKGIKAVDIRWMIDEGRW